MYDKMYPTGNMICAGISQKKGQLAVQGAGKIKARPDIAAVTIGVITEDADINKAMQENNRVSAEVIKAVKMQGVEERDIQTANYVVDTQYDYIDGKQVFRGYKVTNLMEVTIRDIDKAGDVIGAAVNAGANNVSDVSFTLSNPSAYYLKALRIAVKDAGKKAEAVAQTLNTRIMPIPVKIIERNAGDRYTSTKLAMEAAAVPVQPGLLEVTASVEGVYEYEL
ncbi:MAG: SIMPL domain-containing protein [Bacillota bacterium]